jgi:hypothetical protein
MEKINQKLLYLLTPVDGLEWSVARDLELYLEAAGDPGASQAHRENAAKLQAQLEVLQTLGSVMDIDRDEFVASKRMQVVEVAAMDPVGSAELGVFCEYVQQALTMQVSKDAETIAIGLQCGDPEKDLEHIDTRRCLALLFLELTETEAMPVYGLLKPGDIRAAIQRLVPDQYTDPAAALATFRRWLRLKAIQRVNSGKGPSVQGMATLYFMYMAQDTAEDQLRQALRNDADIDPQLLLRISMAGAECLGLAKQEHSMLPSVRQHVADTLATKKMVAEIEEKAKKYASSLEVEMGLQPGTIGIKIGR